NPFWYAPFGLELGPGIPEPGSDRNGTFGGSIGGVLRHATVADVPEICALIGELAEYERLADEAVADPADVAHWLFGPEPRAQVTIAETDSGAGAVAGMALWFWTFSTFLGRPGIWLEDLYVRPAARG